MTIQAKTTYTKVDTARYRKRALAVLAKHDNFGYDTNNQALRDILAYEKQNKDWLKYYDVSDMYPYDINVIDCYLGRAEAIKYDNL